MPPGAPATACVPRLAFGNGVIYWEYFYGARSWLVPGVVAGVLKLFDLVGLGQPWWYVGAVKLLFCALSLAVPAAMYWAGRRHFGEAAARMALLAHSLQAHKEYRFIFVVIPLWLLLGADLATRAAAPASARVRRTPGLRWAASVAGAACLGVSVAGLLNALPYQEQVYRAWSQETGKVSFVRRRMQDPVFAAYRYLARESGVDAVWQVDRAYHGLPGSYYLHRRVPLYDAFTGRVVSQDLATLSASVSHLLVADAAVAVAGYSLEREFGGVRILRRDAGRPPVRQWQEYTPPPAGSVTVAMERV